MIGPVSPKGSPEREALEEKIEKAIIKTRDVEQLESLNTELSQIIKNPSKQFTKADDVKPDFKHLRYPKEQMDSTQDYISFEVIKYERKKGKAGGLTDGPIGSKTEKEFNADRDLNKKITNTITLPVPASIADSNSTDFGQSGMNFLQEFGVNRANAMMSTGNDQEALQGLYNEFGFISSSYNKF